MFGRVQSLHSDRTSARARSLRSDRAGRALGRYVATELWLELGRYVTTRARSLRNDRAGRSLGRYVATELWLELGRYVATELGRARGKHGLSLLRSSGDSIRRFDENAWIDVCRCSEEFNRYTATELWLEPGRYIATERDERSRPSETDARSLRSDRAWLELGLFGLNLQGYFFVKTSYCIFYENYIFPFTISFGNTISEDFRVTFSFSSLSRMSQGVSANARPTIFNRGTVRHGRGEFFREIEFVAHSVDPAEADAYWVAMCNVEEPPPEPWVPIRPFSERVVGRPSRSRTHMEVLKGFPQGGCGWKSYFFYVRLDQASVTVECLPSFRRLWGAGVHNPIPLFPEDLCIVRDLLRGGPLFWGHFSPERVRAAVEAHRSRFSSSIDNVMEASFEDTSLSAVYAAGRSSGRGSLDVEEDGEPTVEDPISCLEMFETRALGLGQDLGLLSVKVCAVTSRLSFFLLRFLPDSYRFKVRDRFSAYMTCMRAFVLVLDVLKIKRVIELRLFKTASVFVGANRRTGCKVFGGRVRTIYDNFTIFGPDEAADKSLNVFRRVLKRGLRTCVELRRPMRRSESRMRSLTLVTSESSPASSFVAIGRGVSSGLVELAEGVFVIPLIASPCVARCPALIRIDRIVMRPLEIFPLVMDVLVVTRIADIQCLVSRFPSLSAFTASELGLPFSQLLLFVPIGDFFLFRHWFFERGAFPSGSASGPSRMSIDVLVGVVGDIARIQVNVFGFVILRVLCRGRKTFRVPLFDGRFFARWGSEVEPLPADFGGSAGTDRLGPCRGEHLFKLLERRGVGLCIGRGYVRYWNVEIGAAASVKRSLHVIRVIDPCPPSFYRQTVGTEIRTVDFRLNKETRKNPNFPEDPDIC
ncbi:hypothetical protein IGI04_023506 [Brassica rapa subsp. trilocularis]|uniref:Uncharacterized protein n=1 Tax=Brassica rapa subsp. trilocularis TaxID=1813537 RepID=A0ABQ7M417_BRACM|nr:hypothetical protein IGI04_023506 [Brassica rapa subsp. trilocularis]